MDVAITTAILILFGAVLVVALRRGHKHDPARARAKAPVAADGSFELAFQNPAGPAKVYLRFEIAGTDTEDMDLAAAGELVADGAAAMPFHWRIGWHAPDLGRAPPKPVPSVYAGTGSTGSFLLAVAPAAPECLVRGVVRGGRQTRLAGGFVYVA